MTSIEKVIAAIQAQLNQPVEIELDSRLEELRLDSLALVELTIRMHTEHGVDLGRMAAELKLVPDTVADLVTLVDASLAKSAIGELA